MLFPQIKLDRHNMLAHNTGVFGGLNSCPSPSPISPGSWRLIMFQGRGNGSGFGSSPSGLETPAAAAR
jgi:hypothetical protein